MSSDISTRIVHLLNKHQDGHGFFSRLESETGIKSASWRAAIHGRQKPTLEMLEAVVSRWPDEAGFIFGNEDNCAIDHHSVALAAAHAYRFVLKNKTSLSSSQFADLVTQFLMLIKGSMTLPPDISETERMIGDEIAARGFDPVQAALDADTEQYERQLKEEKMAEETAKRAFDEDVERQIKSRKRK